MKSERKRNMSDSQHGITGITYFILFNVNINCFLLKDISKGLGFEGLPKNKDLIVKREVTVEHLKNVLEDKITVLITAPPFSGKTCLYQLYGQKYPKCNQISFGNFTGTTFKELDNFFMKSEFGVNKIIFIFDSLYLFSFLCFYLDLNKSIEQCVYNPEKIPLVTDETQLIFHIDHFWQLFKTFQGKIEILLDCLLIFVNYFILSWSKSRINRCMSDIVVCCLWHTIPGSTRVSKRVLFTTLLLRNSIER